MVSAEFSQLSSLGNSRPTTCGFVVTINDKVKQAQKRLQEVNGNIRYLEINLKKYYSDNWNEHLSSN
jgi:hypothetical protein